MIPKNRKLLLIHIRSDENTMLNLLNYIREKYPNEINNSNRNEGGYLTININHYANKNTLNDNYKMRCFNCFHIINKKQELKIPTMDNVYKCERCATWFKL